VSKRTAAKPPAADQKPATEVSGRFFCVGKSDHLLYEAFELEVKDGVVVAVRGLSRAPDLAATAVGACTRELWVNLRTQPALKVTE
jgi:hypothetical protein